MIALLPAAASACAGFCERDALGQSHCDSPECHSCEVCAQRIACVPTKREDLAHESCERWCKAEHAKSHCSTCACRSCGFCMHPAAAEASSQTASAGASPATTGATNLASEADASAAALDALKSLAVKLVARSMAWDDAFKPFDRNHNGKVSSNEVQRVFHENGLKPLPMHGLPAAITTLHGIDYRALADIVARSGSEPPAGVAQAPEQAQARTGDAAASTPPAGVSSAAVHATLGSLAARLAAKQLSWDDAFRPYDRGDGLVGAADVVALLHDSGLEDVALPLHELPSTVTTLHGIDYRALARWHAATDAGSPAAQ